MQQRVVQKDFAAFMTRSSFPPWHKWSDAWKYCWTICAQLSGFEECAGPLVEQLAIKFKTMVDQFIEQILAIQEGGQSAEGER